MLRRDRILGALSALRHASRPHEAESPTVSPPNGEPLRSAARPPLAEILHGRWIETDEGPVFVKETDWPCGHCHGNLRVGSVLEAEPEALRVALGTPGAPHPARLAFLDLETTGLAGGTGTIAFLACVGSFGDDAFHVRQYFLAGIDGERAMLSLLARDISRFEGLVTYNGRAFDVPIIQARMTLSRLPDPCGSLSHFDLLHTVRRLYRHRMPSCRLAEAEGHILGMRRADDVPGHLIPSLYFDYIRAGRVAPLGGVFRHNADDALSMVGILGAVAVLFSRQDPDPRDALSLAKWWEVAGDPRRAEGLYRSAVEGLMGEGCGEEWRMAARRYARLRKRAGERRDVIDVWRQLWLEGDRGAGVEIAKFLEHEARDVRGAAKVTGSLLESATEWDRADLEHRMTRLLRKMETAARRGDGTRNSRSRGGCAR